MRIMRAKLWIVCVALAAGVVGVGSSSAAASESDRTHGAALAALEAGWTGGTVISFQTPGLGKPSGWSPNDDPEDIRIYPNRKGAYCASGWHVIDLYVTASTDPGDPEDPVFDSHQALFDYLESIDVAFTLDGVPLSTKRTAIKAMPAWELLFGGDAYWFGVGVLVPPGTLTLGAHKLTSTITGPAGTEKWSVRIDVLPC